MGPFVNRLFLVKCWRQNKLLFFIILFFIGAAIYGHRTGCEITPALDFAMYSGIHHTRTDSFLLVKANGRIPELYHTIDEPRRMMVYSTLAAYHRGALAGYHDPAEPSVLAVVNRHPFMGPLSHRAVCRPDDYAQYPSWLLKYLQTAVDKDIRAVDILLLHLHYNEQELPVTDSIKHLYTFEPIPVK